MPVTFSEFEKSSLSAWKDKANTDLKGKMLADDLNYQVEPGLMVPVFLDSEGITPQNPPILYPSSKVGAIISNLKNDTVRRSLEQGAESLLIRWQDNTPIAPIFDGVIIDIIEVIVDDRHCSRLTNSALKHYMMTNNHENVSFLSDGINELRANTSFLDRNRIIKSEPGTNIILELKSDFLAQIAELRAIRIITQNQPIKIWATLDPMLAESSDRQSLIAINYALMSAYLGGVDVAFGCPYREDESMGRLSLNIQHILQLESGICDVIDPLAGSYIVEKLTAAILG